MSRTRITDRKLSNKKKFWILAGLTLLLLAIDQVIKFAVKLNMAIGESFPMFGDSDWARILFIENNGMAFGMQLGGIGGKLLLSVFRLVLIGVIVWFLIKIIKKRNPSWGVLIGLVLILVGAVGNMIDSTFYGRIFTESTRGNVAELVSFGDGYAPLLCGRVVDMFYFPMVHWIWPDWIPFVGGDEFEFFSPVFNFADACISVGVVYLIIFQRRFFNVNPKQKDIL